MKLFVTLLLSFIKAVNKTFPWFHISPLRVKINGNFFLVTFMISFTIASSRIIKNINYLIRIKILNVFLIFFRFLNT